VRGKQVFDHSHHAAAPMVMVGTGIVHHQNRNV